MFICIVGLLYMLILVSEHEIICRYACINILKKYTYNISWGQ